MSQIVMLKDIKLWERCPNCQSLNIRRTSKPEDVQGQSLYRVIEKCNKCGLDRVWRNVKVA